jgi:hypothetical protein
MRFTSPIFLPIDFASRLIVIISLGSIVLCCVLVVCCTREKLFSTHLPERSGLWWYGVIEENVGGFFVVVAVELASLAFAFAWLLHDAGVLGWWLVRGKHSDYRVNIIICFALEIHSLRLLSVFFFFFFSSLSYFPLNGLCDWQVAS